MTSFDDDDNPFADLDWHLDKYGDLAWCDDMMSLNTEQLALYLDCSEPTARLAMNKLLTLHADAVKWRVREADAAARRPRVSSLPRG